MVFVLQSSNGVSKQITLYFLVAGKTKNIFDVAFVLAKRKLRTVYMDHPKEMMRFIEESSQFNLVICRSLIKWGGYKPFLGPFFAVLGNLII